MFMGVEDATAMSSPPLTGILGMSASAAALAASRRQSRHQMASQQSESKTNNRAGRI